MTHWAEKYIGVPFVDGGRDISGCDCWGLLRLIYQRELNKDLPSYAEIPAKNLIEVARAVTAGKNEEIWTAVEYNEVEPFDAVVMKFSGTKRTGHVGVAIDNKRLLHVEKGTNAAIVPFTHFTIRERIQCFRRLK